MRRRRLVPLLVALALLVYVGSYIARSSQGRYVELICGTSDGSQVWYPRGCENRTRSPSGRIKTDVPSPLGWLYLPLLVLDQKLVHPDRPGPWDAIDRRQHTGGARVE
jgi:hypothetical protein